jgi:hypothetical protein
MTHVVSCLDPAHAAAGLRSHQLADRLERGMTALLSFAGTLTDDQWATPVPGDGRTVGVVVHHVASVYPLEIQLAQTLAAGDPIAGVAWADVHALNATHARDHAAVTKAEAMALLEMNGAAAARTIRLLSDAELARAATVSLYDDAELTCQFVLEDHAVRHAWHHLARIRTAIGR